MCYPQQLGNLWKVFYRNTPELCLLCAPDTAPDTSQNLISHLHRNPPEPHPLSALELSGTSSAICTRTLRNLISHLHRKAPAKDPIASFAVGEKSQGLHPSSPVQETCCIVEAFRGLAED